MGKVLQHFTPGKIRWMSRSPVTLIFFFTWQGNRWLSLNAFGWERTKEGEKYLHFFTYLKLSPLSAVRKQFISPSWSKQAFVIEKALSDLHVAQLVGSFPPGNKHTIDKPSWTSLKQEKRLFHPTPSDKNVIHVGANASGMDWLKWLLRGFLVGQWIFFYMLDT